MTFRRLAASAFFLFLTSMGGSAVAQQCTNGCAPDNVPPNCPLNIDGSYVAPKLYSIFGCHSGVVKSYGDAGTTTCDATPPQGTILVDFRAIENSSNNGSYTASRITKGANIELVKEITEEYDAKIKEAADAGDDKAKYELEQMKASHLKILTKYSTNMDIVHVETYASGHGWDLDRKRGWEDVDIYLSVACVSPADLSDQIDLALKKTATSAVIANQSGEERWVTSALVEGVKTTCSQASHPVSTLIGPAEKSRIFNLKSPGKEFKLCYLIGDSNALRSGKTPDFSRACEATAGDRFQIAANTTYPCEFN